MKVILKGGSPLDNSLIRNFFLDKIFPLLSFGIAFEESTSIIRVIEHDPGKPEYVDPTAEVVVELTEEARILALDPNISEDVLRSSSGQFFDEAMAIRKIESLARPFSVEYYSCRYSPAKKEGAF